MTEDPGRPLPGEGLGPPAEADPAEQLLRRRLVLVQGHLGPTEATRVAAGLMSLDALGDEPVQLLVNSRSGTWEGALTVMDTVAALGVPAEAICLGAAEGPALGVLAVARRRAAGPHARLGFTTPELAVAGRADQVHGELEWQLAQQGRWIEAVARATGQPAERVEVDLRERRRLGCQEALRYGLIDAVTGQR